MRCMVQVLTTIFVVCCRPTHPSYLLIIPNTCVMGYGPLKRVAKQQLDYKAKYTYMYNIYKTKVLFIHLSGFEFHLGLQNSKDNKTHLRIRYMYKRHNKHASNHTTLDSIIVLSPAFCTWASFSSTKIQRIKYKVF